MQTSARIAALEGALARLRMRDEESEDEEPLPPYLLPLVPTWDQDQAEPQRGRELVETLVMAGLAKEIGGRDNVASGAA